MSAPVLDLHEVKRERWSGWRAVLVVPGDSRVTAGAGMVSSNVPGEPVVRLYVSAQTPEEIERVGELLIEAARRMKAGTS